MSLLPDWLSDYVRAGWLRWLPHEANTIFLAVGALTEEEREGDLDEQPEDSDAGKLLAEVPLDEPTWQSQSAEAEEHPEERELVRAAIERLNRGAAQQGTGPIETNRDVLELMSRIGLITRTEDGGMVEWRLGSVPLPEDVLDLTPEEREEEDRIRWANVYERSAQRIVQLFVDEELPGIETSLASLGERLGLDPEDARHSIANLLEEGDFATSVPVDRVDPQQPFRLTVDWEKFNEQRISVKFPT